MEQENNDISIIFSRSKKNIHNNHVLCTSQHVLFSSPSIISVVPERNSFFSKQIRNQGVKTLEKMNQLSKDSVLPFSVVFLQKKNEPEVTQKVLGCLGETRVPWIRGSQSRTRGNWHHPKLLWILEWAIVEGRVSTRYRISKSVSLCLLLKAISLFRVPSDSIEIGCQKLYRFKTLLQKPCIAQLFVQNKLIHRHNRYSIKQILHSKVRRILNRLLISFFCFQSIQNFYPVFILILIISRALPWALQLLKIRGFLTTFYWFSSSTPPSTPLASLHGPNTNRTYSVIQPKFERSEFTWTCTSNSMSRRSFG